MKITKTAYTLSGLGLILSAAFTLPLAFSLYDRDGLTWIYVAQIVAMAGGGIGLRILTEEPSELSVREGFLTVSLSWVVVCLLGSIPFMLSGYIPSFTDAFFETMSGFTTTGASILTDIERLPRSLLVWRDMIQWLGGMGVIALAVAIFPYLGVGGLQLFKAEVPGPVKDKISPRVSETARLLWGVYLIFTVAETTLLMFGGLTFFEALCTTFGTMATGGFHPRNASVGAYASPYVHYVITLFMFIAGGNFVLHYWAIRGSPGHYFRNSEFKFFLFVVIGGTSLITCIRLLHGHPFSEKLFRGSLFQTVSIVSTTGFVTEDYEGWPFSTQMILILLMFIGGCTSSTGGAIKNARIIVLLKYIASELRKIFHPHGVYPVKIGDRMVPENIVSNVVAFVALYFIIFGFGVVAMTCFGMDLSTSVGAVAATLGNVGPGIGSVGPAKNYSHIPIAGKWILSFLMMTGRLEIFTVLVLFARGFWR